MQANTIECISKHKIETKKTDKEVAVVFLESRREFFNMVERYWNE